jgi:hypothetical protein
VSFVQLAVERENTAALPTAKSAVHAREIPARRAEIPEGTITVRRRRAHRTEWLAVILNTAASCRADGYSSVTFAGRS